MKLVNVGAEVSSVMMWRAVMLFFNGGVILIILSQMSTVNRCDENLTRAFFYPGAFAMGLGSLGLFLAVLTEWVVPLAMRFWRWFDE